MGDASLISITTQFDPRLALLLGWIVFITKTAIDGLKTAVVLPVWAPPLLALAGAFVLMLVLMVAIGIPMTFQLAAQALICALVAAVLAVGQTALQNRTRPAVSPVDEITASALRIRAERLAQEVAEDRMDRGPHGSA